MEIIDGYVEWLDDFANRPGLYLIIKDPPKQSDLRYHQKDWAFFAEKDGYVSFYSWRGWEDNSNSGGYGGLHIEITMTDESKKILKGPWSSNCNAMEVIGFGSSINVAAKIVGDPLNVWYSTNLRPEIIIKYLDRIKPFNNKKSTKYKDKIKNGKVRYDFEKDEPFVSLENGESFYKPLS